MTIHDEAIASRVKSAIAMDKRLSNLAIDVRVAGRDVYLKGKVDSPEQIAVVEFIIRGIPGVRSIDIQEVDIKGGSA